MGDLFRGGEWPDLVACSSGGVRRLAGLHFSEPRSHCAQLCFRVVGRSCHAGNSGGARVPCL